MPRKRRRRREPNVRASVGRKRIGGEGGIRTLDTGFGPYNCLAGSPVRPLQHLSARWYVPQEREVIAFQKAEQPSISHSNHFSLGKEETSTLADEVMKSLIALANIERRASRN